MENDRLTGRRALVTGAGRRGGIGRATALALAGAGADVFVADFERPAETAEVVDAIRTLGRRAEFDPVRPALVGRVQAHRSRMHRRAGRRSTRS